MSGAEIPESVRANVRRAAGDRCGYCQSPQHLVMGKLEIEHIIPRSSGGTDDESNLWLSCSLCNRYKGAQVEFADPETNAVMRLFNPRKDDWQEHWFGCKNCFTGIIRPYALTATLLWTAS
jgi:5-methylcytosine-specific restriction endonuclease McrA